jgi:hypothetical protein
MSHGNRIDCFYGPHVDAENHALHGVIQTATELKAQQPLNATILKPVVWTD